MSTWRLDNNGLASLPEDVFDGLTRLERLKLDNNSLTSLPDDVFDSLTRLERLELDDNSLTSLPDGVFDDLTSLTTLRLGDNPNAIDPVAFPIPYKLVRTDTGGNTARPATIQVRLPAYVPAELRNLDATLSVTGGTLTVASGSPAASVMVALDTDVTVNATGDPAVIVSATAPSGQTATNGMVIGDAVALRAITGNTPAEGTPTISGTVALEEDWVADTSAISDLDGPQTLTFSYQWQRSTDGTFDSSNNISGATSATYQLVGEDLGKYLRIVVSFTDSAGNVETVASSASIIGTDLCSRTPLVRDAILALISGVTDCATVTTAQLNALTGILDLGDDGLTSLAAGDFDGLTGLTTLWLHSNSIEMLPDGVFDDLDSLTTLWLYSNSITSLPDDVFDGLDSLVTLWLYNNNMTALPEGVFDGLTSLEFLRVDENSIAALPEDVFDGLTSLTHLDLSDNSIASLPEDVFDGLTSLTNLDLSDNSIASLPEDVFDGLASLTELYLFGNSITALPEDVFDGLTGLVLLRLDSNDIASVPIASFPEGVFDGLGNLSFLALSDNSLTSLPEGIFNGLTGLATLILDDNSIETLPADVFDGLTSLTVLSLTNNSVTSLPDDVFDGLTSLTTLYLENNNIASFPTTALSGLPALGTAGGFLQIEENPDMDSPPFGIPYELVRTDGGTGDPATIQVRLPAYVPAELRNLDASLSVTGGTLTIGGGTAATSVTVALDTDVTVNATGDPAVIVSATAPSGQTATNGMVIGDAVVLRAITGNTPAEGTPTISGTVALGEDWVADTSAISDLDGPQTLTFSYQWQRSTDGTFDSSNNIDGATSATYQLEEDDLGKYLRIVVSFTDSAGNVETVASSASIIGTDLCGRTAQVQTGILVLISGVTDCATVTTAQLNALTGILDLGDDGLTSLAAGDFAGLTGLTTLWLHSNSIEMLPDGVFDDLDSLTTLWLDSNSLTSLPEDVFDGLTSLTHLDLEDNSLASLPEDVFDGLTSLTHLDLEDNSLTSLPEDVFDGLTSLAILELDDNSVASLPDDVFDGLASLTELYLDNNGITSLPDDVFDGLTSLTTLILDDNSIETLPADVFDGLTSLTILFLTNNSLTSLPEGVFDGLTGLATLILDDNSIETLPADVFDGLTSLTVLSLTNNSVTSLPDDVFDGLTSLTTLYLENNNIASFPTTALSGLSALGTAGGFLRIEENPDMDSPPFSIPYELVRTDGGTGDPATIQVRLPAYVPAELRNLDASLSITGGTLTIGGGTAATSVTVALDTDVTVNATGDPAVIVSATAPSGQTATNGMVIGDAVVLRAITGNTPAEGTPTISGTVALGEDWVADTSAIIDPDGPQTLTFSYQWQRSTDGTFDSSNNISGATSATYQLVGEDLGKYLRIVVSFTDSAGNVETVASSASIIGTDLCGRTPLVRDAILALISGVTDCATVTTAQLNALTGTLALGSKGLTSLAAGDFAGLTGLTTLWLHSNSIEMLPDGVFDGLDSLTSLWLYNNSIASLPDDVFDGLDSLVTLWLYNNNMTALPEGVFDGLTSLEFLRVDENSIAALPEDVLDGLTSLTHLDLSDNSIASLPEDVFDGLTSLTNLDLSDNSIASLPDDVFDGLASLTELYLFGNRITALPEDVFDGLTGLVLLRLDSNDIASVPIASFPEGIFDGLVNLSFLALSDNSLTSLPEGVFDGLTGLATLILDDNSIETLPADVFDGLTSLTVLSLTNNSVTSLPDDVFDGLTSLTTLYLENNNIASFPTTALSGLPALGTAGGFLQIEENPDMDSPPFSIPYELVRTDGGTGDPATIQVRLPAYVPAELRNLDASLSVTGGTLTIGEGTAATSVTVALDTDVMVNATGGPAVIVSATAPSGQTATNGMVIGDAVVLRAITGNTPAEGTPTISGTVALGEDWVADTSAIIDPDGPQTLTFSYQWQRSTDGTFDSSNNISGATSATYQLVGEDLGKYLRIVVSFTDSAGNVETVASSASIIGTDLCGRTPLVRDAILALISGVTDCATVTATQLNALTGILDLGDDGLTSLAAGDFAGLTGLTTLWLHSNSIEMLPDGVFDDLDSLTSLWLYNNSIASLPDDVFDGLDSLVTLWLYNNNMTALPEGVFDGLTSLEFLRLDENGITSLQPDVLDGLTSLTHLDLSDNSIASLPEDVFDGLTSLTNLDLSDNSVASLPDDVFDGLASLTELYLFGNSITALPEDVFDGLTGLVLLRLDSNDIASVPIASFPEGVFDGLVNLSFLALSDNSLTSLPEGIFNGLTGLATLIVDDNSIETLPADVFDGLTSLTVLSLTNNSVTSLPDDVFDGLTSLTTLYLENNNIASFPTTAFSGLPALGTAGGFLRIEENPDMDSPPFGIPYELVRTDGGTGDPATIQVRLPAYVPAELRNLDATLSVTGGTLTIGGGTAATSVTVALDTDVTVNATGDPAVIVSATAPSGQTATNGMVIGDAVVLRAITGNTPAEGTPTISGTVALGEDWVADTSAISDLDGPQTLTFSYQWQRSTDGTFDSSNNIDGATSATYQLEEDDLGKYLRIVVSFTDSAGNVETVASSASIIGTDLCGRTAQVQTGILALISGVTDCATVTTAQLNALTGILDLGDDGLTSLAAGDFAGLTGLTTLWLHSNSIEMLPDGVFDDLDSLTTLWLDSNSLTSLPEDVFDGLDSLVTLWLYNNSLTALPEGVFDGLTSLEFLRVDENSIAALPEDVFDGLTSLTHLDLSDNSIASLPEDVFDGLTSLTNLDLSDNSVASLPDDVFDGLASLTELYLFGNSITALPEDVFDGLTGLVLLRLDSNDIASVPIASFPEGVFDGLVNLSLLALSDNSLTALPEGIFNGLTGLATLILDDNSIETLPADVFDGLTSLTVLSLTNNSVTSLPDDVFDGLTSLTTLYLENNNIASFPTTALSGLPALGTAGGFLQIEENPDMDSPPFSIPYELVRTDGGTGDPATIQVRLPAYVPAELRNLDATLSVTGGTLTVASGSPAASVMVALDTDVTVNATGDPAVIVSATAPSGQTATNGMVIGDAVVLRAITGNTPAEGTPTISGTVALGEDWVADTSAIIDPDGPQTLTFSYQWQRSTDGAFDSSNNISGATSATYQLVGEDLGKYLRIVVSFTDSAGNVETVASSASIIGTDLCGRTPLVRDAILALISGVTDCATVTTAQLNALTGTLALGSKGLTSLAAGDFDGLTSLTVLQLSRNSITSLPADIFDGLTGLTTLWLHNNRVELLPEDVFDGLTNLDRVSLRSNRITALPEDIFNGLASLTNLDLATNSISSLPEDVFDGLASLANLDLTSNDIASLPEDVFDGLTNLTRLDLDSNKIVSVPIASLPEGIFDGLISLTRLDLKGNSITSLPSDIFEGLAKLDTLWLADNNIASLPEDIFDGLASLTTLFLDDNRISSLPDDVFDGLTSLTDLSLANNNISSFPTRALSVLPALGTDGGVLKIEDNPNVGSSSFSIPYKLMRTDGGTGSPATIRVSLPLYVPSELRDLKADLSVTDGTLTIGVDTPATSITVALGTDVTVTPTGDPAVIVSATAPAGQTAVYGMRIGNAVALRAITENTPAEGTPTITGTTTEEQTLAVTISGFTDVDGLADPVLPTGYQWHRGDTSDFDLSPDTPITSADTSTYILQLADVGKYLRVVVSFNDLSGREESLASMATAQIQGLNNLPTGVPAIAGEVRVGELLTASVGTLDDADGLPNPLNPTYQWQRSDNVDFTGTPTDIATGTTYTLVPADENSYIRVVASFMDSRDIPESVPSEATAQIEAKNNLPTGMPAIAGEVRVGELLTASVGTLDDADGLPNPLNPTYQWQRSDNVDFTGTPTDIATGTTYTLVANDQNHYIRVIASFLDSRDIPESVPSAATEQIEAQNNLPTGAPAIAGEVRVGELLTASVGTLDDADGLPNPLNPTYQWQRSDNADFTGTPTNIATGTTYTLISDDETNYIRVIASFLDSRDIPESVPSAATAQIEAKNNLPTGAPAIAGEVRVGELLTASVGTLDDADGLPNPLNPTYQWQRSDNVDFTGTPTDITTGTTYTLVANDQNHYIRVVASFLDSRDIPESVPSEATAQIEAKNNLPTGTPAIAGEVRVGERLTASADTLGDLDGLPNPLNPTYQWQRSDNVDFTGTPTDIATGTTYTLVPADENNYIRVVASFLDSRNIPESVPSPATAQIEARENRPAIGLPTITGATMAGQRLTADISRISDPDGLGAFSYQWQRSDDEAFSTPTDISGATNQTYRLTDADTGKFIRVIVSFNDARGTAEIMTSGTTAAISPAIFTRETMSAVGAVVDLSTATVFTEAVATHLGAPSTGLRIDGQPAGSRLRSILQAVVPAGNQCLQAELDPHERLQYGISGSSLTASPCGSMDSDEMMRRLRSAAEVGDVSLGLAGKESGLDIWLHATSFEVSGSPLINGAELNYDGGGMLAYVGVALKAGEKTKYGFTLGLSDTALDLALVAGGARNDTVSRNLMFGSGFIDYRLGSKADYRLRAVLGMGAGDADFTVINDANNQTVSGSAGADLTFFTLNFSKEFKLGEKWSFTPAIQLANSSGSTDAVTLTGDGDDVLMDSGSSSASEFAIELDLSRKLSNGGQFTIGSAFRSGSGDLEYSGAVDLKARYQSRRFSAQIQQQVVSTDNERNSYSVEYVVVQSKRESRKRFDLTLGTDYNRTTNYVASGEERDGPLSLGYFGRFSYGFGKGDEAGSGSLDTRLRLNQDGEVSTDLSLNIRF